MKTFALAIAALSLWAYAPQTASAQCDFNALAKAKGIKGSMVREFAGCGSTTQHPTPNTQTSSGTPTPACEPVEPHADGAGNQTPYALDPTRGGCSVQIAPKLVADCSKLKDDSGASLGLPAGPCQPTYLKVRCKGVYQSASLDTQINENDDSGFTLNVIYRASMNDPDNGDMTLIDVPAAYPLVTGKGKLGLSAGPPYGLIGLPGSPVPGVAPACSQSQILSVRIFDPEGRPFAALGSGTRD